MGSTRRKLLAASAVTVGLSGCLGSDPNETTISKVYASNWLREPRRVAVQLRKEERTIIDDEYTIPPAEDPEMGFLPLDMDGFSEPARFSISAQYPDDTSYRGDSGGFTADPVNGGENDCTFLNVHIHRIGTLTLLKGTHGCVPEKYR